MKKATRFSYDKLETYSSFDELVGNRAYTKIPADWFVGVADIENSTLEIEAGRYKVVNSVGAAVISAQINAFDHAPFPYVFGGDGAGFAFAPAYREKSETALREVKRWALEEFDINLRVAIVPVSDIRRAGHEIAVAKHQASPDVAYAMFSGGGIRWAENQMKAGNFALEAAPEGAFPDLTGLSCRWMPINAKHGKILSVIIQPRSEAPKRKVTKLLHDIIQITDGLTRSGRPTPDGGPSVSWPPEGLDIEARATHREQSLFVRKLHLAFETLLAWVFFKTGWKAGEFDPVHYAETVSRNADFRKFDDGLKFTLDCQDETADRLEALLENARAQGLLEYGIHKQDSAIITCIVPSIHEDNHVHFVDGGAGGYAVAALQMKRQAGMVS